MKIKNTIKSIIEDSTVHGIPRLLKSNSLISKITWIIFFCLSTSCCIYLIISAIFNYLQYSVVTTIETIIEIPTILPVITICNLDQFQTSDSYFIKQGYSQIPYLSNVLKNLFIMSEINSYEDTVRKSLAYSLNESLISCEINTLNCGLSDFVWYFDSLYGNCYSFNSGKNSQGYPADVFKISRAGNINGLRLKLFIGNNLNDMASFQELLGYHVIIHNQTYKITLNEGFDISTGVETNFAIYKVYETNKPNPYSDCIDLNSIDSFDSNLYRVIYASNKTYRQIDCFDLCFQQLLIKRCDCYMASWDRLNGTIQCLTESQRYCTKLAWNFFISNDYVSKTCRQYCPLECNSISYKLTTSFSSFPSKSYADSLKTHPIITSKFSNETLTYESIKQSVLSLNIYYDQLAFTQISKEAKFEIVDLISAFGGLLGLFLGMSFLSFVEIVEIILETFVILFEKKKVSSEVTQIINS